MDADEKDMELIQSHVDQLREHFDSVTIGVTRYESGGLTTNIVRGSGNFYARVGQMKDWIIVQDEGTKVDTRKANE